jgi:hypothetical protein
MSDAKTAPTSTNVDELLAGVADPGRRADLTDRDGRDLAPA